MTPQGIESEELARLLYSHNSMFENLWVPDPSAPYDGAVKWNDAGALAMAKSILDRLDPIVSAAELVASGSIGRNITFLPGDDQGNAVVSPDEPEGPYWTLIAQGGDGQQNAVAAEIVRRLNGLAAQSPDLAGEKTPLRHVDDMNDMVLMGLARDDAEREVKSANEEIARLKAASAMAESEVQTIQLIAAAAVQDIASLESAWPSSKRGSRGQRALDDIKMRWAGVKDCSRDARASLTPSNQQREG